MEIFVLSGALVLVVGGCVCVVWGARGGPRWVRGVARVMLVVGEVLSASSRGSRKSGGSGDGSSSSGDGS